MRLVNEAIIHTLATRSNWMPGKSNEDKLAEVRRGHVEGNGWRDIGYNFVIFRDGTVLIGRDLDGDGDTWEEIGAHAKGHNATTIGIALEGGYGGNANDLFSDHYTVEQEFSLMTLLDELRAKFGEVKITGHNQYANKACPCFSVPNWLAMKERAPRTNLAQSKTLQASQITKAAVIASPVLGAIGGMPWQNLLIMGVIALVALVALGVIDVERFKKWKAGDR